MLRIVFFVLAGMLAAGSAQAADGLVKATSPSGTSSAFNAIATFNYGNQKARLEAVGQTTVQGGNPGNGWWGAGDGSGGLLRSWEVIWNSSTGSVTFHVYSGSDYTGLAMTMSSTPSFAPGETLVGLDIGARLSSATQGVTLGNVEFNGGSGFVSVPTANASYSGDAWFNNYHALIGAPTSFTLRGTAQFTAGSVTSDGMRWFVNARQGVAGFVPYCFGDNVSIPCPCGNDAAVGSGTGCINSLGTGGLLAASGTASISNDTLVLTGSGMPNSFVVYIQGTVASGSGAGTVFGDGKMCVTGSIMRLGTVLNSGGGSSVPNVANPIPLSVRGSISSPGIRNYQIYYRDPVPYCTAGTFNLTNAVNVPWSL